MAFHTRLSETKLDFKQRIGPVHEFLKSLLEVGKLPTHGKFKGTSLNGPTPFDNPLHFRG